MNIEYFVSVSIARWYVVITVLFATVATALGISLVLPKVYTAEATVVLDTSGSDLISGGIAASALMPTQGYVLTQVDIMKSRKVALRVVRDLKIDTDPGARQAFERERKSPDQTIEDFFADQFLETLRVTPSRESRVVTVGFSAGSPEMAAQIANAFARAYVDTALEMKVLPAQRNAQWYEQQVSKLQVDLENARRKLSEYQQQKSIPSSDERWDIESARLAELSSQLSASQGASAEAQARAEQVQMIKSGKASADTMPDVMANPMVQQLQVDIHRAQARLEDLSARLGQNHPDIQRTIAEIASLRQQLSYQIEAVLGSVQKNRSLNERRQAELAAAVATQKSKVLSMRQDRDEIEMLYNEVQVAQKSYDVALQRLDQIRMESVLNQTNVEILTEATPPQFPSSPKILLNTLLAIFVGTALGLGFGLLSEFLDTRVRSRRDLEDLLGIALLGEITNKEAKKHSRRYRLPFIRSLRSAGII